jgi:bifunctional enzyme CysN/CysC
LKNFTGVDAPYEAPESAELVLNTASNDPDTAADAMIEAMRGWRLV